MKFKLIPTFQRGGGYGLPYVVYKPAPRASQQTTTTTSTKKEDKGLTDKDLVQLLEKLDGLPNDMLAITQQLQDFYINNSNSLLSIGDTIGIESRYIDILSQLKVANFNKKEYDNAYTQVSRNGGLDEVAVDEFGRFFCRNDKNDFQLLTAEQLKDSDGEYIPLTNAQLLDLRAQSPALVNNNQPLNIVQHGIGMDVVTSMIQKALNNLGTNENVTEGYIKTDKGKLLTGIEAFEEAVKKADSNAKFNDTVNDLYKYKYLTKTQAENAINAFNYIYMSLPENVKAFLKYKSGKLTEEGAQELVQSLIASKISNTRQLTLDLKTLPITSGSSGSNENDKLKITFLGNLIAGQGSETTFSVMNKEGTMLTVYGMNVGGIQESRNGRTIGATTLEKLLSESNIQGLTNTQKITFGDYKLNNADLGKIVYDGKSGVRVILPIKDDGTVNLEMLDDYAKAQEEIQKLDNPNDYKEINKILENYDFDNLYKQVDNNFEINTDKFGVFLVVNGYATSDSFGKYLTDSENQENTENQKNTESTENTESQTGHYITKIDKGYIIRNDEYLNAAKLIENIINNSGSSSTNGNYKLKTRGLLDSGYDHIYKAQIYIPIYPNYIPAITGDNQNVSTSVGDVLTTDYQISEKSKTAGTASSYELTGK